MDETTEIAQVQPRRPRATRKAAERKKSWTPPTLLPDPNPEEGYVFRWVRTATLGVADPTNISGKMREGWEPVKASDHPELQVQGAGIGRFKGCVEIGGLILCKMPAEFAAQRNDYYQQQAQAQMQSVVVVALSLLLVVVVALSRKLPTAGASANAVGGQQLHAPK